MDENENDGRLSVKSQGRYSLRSRESRNEKSDGSKNKFVRYEDGEVEDFDDCYESKIKRRRKGKRKLSPKIGKRSISVYYSNFREEPSISMMNLMTTILYPENIITTK